MPYLMDIDDLAKYLKLEKQTIYNWLHQKKISGIKVGHLWRFDKSAVDRWLRQHTVQAANPTSLKKKKKIRKG